MEDGKICNLDYFLVENLSNNGSVLFGVLDGHGGDATVNRVVKELP
jgi:hypothetical protein